MVQAGWASIAQQNGRGSQTRQGWSYKEVGVEKLPFLVMGTRAEFSTELGIKVASGEQFGISFKRTVKAN